MSWAFRRRSSTGWGKERMKKWSIGNLWKKYKYVGLVVLAGIVLMVLPAGTSAPDPQKDSGGFSLEDTERRMEELLGRMDGVGRVQVMLTLKNGSSLELAEDADSTERDGETWAQREPVTLNRGSGYQDVVVTRETYPVYLGAVVVSGRGQQRRSPGGNGGGGGTDGPSRRPHHGGAMEFITGGTDMKKRWKKPAVAAAVLLLVCAAVYMNWRYTDDIQKNAGKTLGQTTLVSSQDGEKGTEPTAAPAEDDYFATARLSRKQARDNAISMLKEAERDENAQQSVLNEASQTLQVLAAYTVAESQIESLVTAKGYADCVVFMGAESVSVVVAPPEGGLTATDAARIKDIVISETDYTAQQIKIMEAN